MAKSVNLYLRYLLHHWRMWFRAYFLLKIKKRFEFHAGPSKRKRSAMYDGYVLERRDHITNKNYLMVYDELFGRWIQFKVSSGEKFYGNG